MEIPGFWLVMTAELILNFITNVIYAIQSKFLQYMAPPGAQILHYRANKTLNRFGLMGKSVLLVLWRSCLSCPGHVQVTQLCLPPHRQEMTSVV